MLEVAITHTPSTTAMPHLLLKRDHPRAIDAFIDYFGTGQRAANSSPGVGMTAKEAV